jgi:hypothetical protein
MTGQPEEGLLPPVSPHEEDTLHVGREPDRYQTVLLSPDEQRRAVELLEPAPETAPTLERVL